MTPTKEQLEKFNSRVNARIDRYNAFLLESPEPLDERPMAFLMHELTLMDVRLEALEKLQNQS